MSLPLRVFVAMLKRHFLEDLPWSSRVFWQAGYKCMCKHIHWPAAQIPGPPSSLIFPNTTFIVPSCLFKIQSSFNPSLVSVSSPKPPVKIR